MSDLVEDAATLAPNRAGVTIERVAADLDLRRVAKTRGVLLAAIAQLDHGRPLDARAILDAYADALGAQIATNGG